MSTASNKDSQAPMNDVELKYRIADLFRSAYLRGKRSEDMTETIHELRDLAMVEVAKHDAQEKANLQVALEAELPLDVATSQTSNNWGVGFNEALKQAREAIAAVFNKGDR